jgi:hypothetical protein
MGGIMADVSLLEGIVLPKGFDSNVFSSLLLTFSSVDYADQFVDKTFPGLVGNYFSKFKVLNAFFEFTMLGGYYPEGQSEDDKVKADYLFTLQHLLNKVKVVGIECVVKK